MGRSKNNPRQLFTRDYFSKDNTLKYPVGGIGPPPFAHSFSLLSTKERSGYNNESLHYLPPKSFAISFSKFSPLRFFSTIFPSLSNK